MMGEETKREKIAKVVGTLLSDAYQTGIDTYRKAVEEYGNKPVREIIEQKRREIKRIALGYSILNAADKRNLHNLSCLLEHHDFLENILTKLFEETEGFSCSADKARRIISYLTRKFSGQPLPDLKKNEYYNPEAILKEDAEILNFFTAFKKMTQGDPVELGRVYEKAKKCCKENKDG